MKDAARWFSRVITHTHAASTTIQRHGVTQTEAEAIVHGEANLEKGLRRGDISIDPQGFYVFKRKSVEESWTTADTAEAKSSAQIDEKQFETVESMMTDFAWGKFAIEEQTLGPKALSNGASSNEVPLKIGATSKALTLLQDGYDTMTKTVRVANTSARELSALIDSPESDPAGTVQQLVAATHKSAREVQEKLDELDDLMTTPRIYANLNRVVCVCVWVGVCMCMGGCVCVLGCSVVVSVAVVWCRVVCVLL
jgi:hypothetical protein